HFRNHIGRLKGVKILKTTRRSMWEKEERTKMKMMDEAVREIGRLTERSQWARPGLHHQSIDWSMFTHLLTRHLRATQRAINRSLLRPEDRHRRSQQQ
ncbi:hypothetical protein PMAYCL1PPCAC_03161, partial [Pristionchus mayeri]